MKGARLRALGATLLVAGILLARGGDALSGPDEQVAYGPVPPGIDAVASSERDRVLATMALGVIDGPRPEGAAVSRALLVLLEDAGLKAVAERLAAGKVPTDALPHLLQVVASSAHPEADLVLERAAGERRPVLRMLAADGLGRGRSARAVPALAALTQDPVPAVRIAALRSLFALETEEAVAARLAVPPDGDPDLLAARLRWHDRCEDASDELREIATQAWCSSRSVALRLAAGRLLTAPGMNTPTPLLLDLVQEVGTNPLIARLMRWARGLPRAGYDPVAMRRLAIRAAFALLARADLPTEARRDLIDRCVFWVARPVEMDPYSRDPIPEVELRRRLPDLGREIVEPVVARLRAGHFSDPRAGVLLLRELGAEIALPILRSLLTPRTETPAFESRAEAGRRRALRTAASGVLQELRRIGDEGLARTLLKGAEPQALKIDIVRALEREEGAWVVPLLRELVAGEDLELRSYALDILERRLEPEARTILVDDLFFHMERPEDRLRALVRTGDEAGLALLERALKDRRSRMRKVALGQFRRERNPRLCGREGRVLLRAFEPDLRSPEQIQEYIYALLGVEPLRAVRYVKETWTRFPSRKVRSNSLWQLRQTRGSDALREAIDFAFEIAKAEQGTPMLLNVASVLHGHWKHRAADVNAFWRRLLTAEALALQRAAVRALDTAGASDMTDLLLPLLRRALAGEALAEDAGLVDEQEFAREILKALRHQPWEEVEPSFIEVATHPLNQNDTRELAAHYLKGKLSAEGRRRLMAWLDCTPQPAETAGEPKPEDRGPGAQAGSGIQWLVAAAVGEGAGPAEAAILQETLKRELFAFYSHERLARLRSTSLASVDAGAPADRLRALASAVAHTRHVPTIASLLDLVFDLRFALYARTAVQRQAATLRVAGAGAAALRPSDILNLAHQDTAGGDLFAMPTSVFEVLSQVKVLDDEPLAAALRRVLQAARDNGRLAYFPDLYLVRVMDALNHKWTGAKTRSAEVIYEFQRALEPIEGAVDYYTETRRVTELSLAGRFAEAAEAQRRAVRILARGNHGDRRPATWRLARARLDALEGADFAARGLEEQARDRFRGAVLRGPNDPDTLNTVAWERALVGFDLDRAEAEARRATMLEARVDSRPSLNAADTLAYVLLLQGKPHAALAVLEPRMREQASVRDGLLHFHMAQMYAAAGRLEESRASLIEAFIWDRTLEPVVRADRFLKPFQEGSRLDKLLRQAAAKRTVKGY